jgi:hypothetical protein
MNQGATEMSGSKIGGLRAGATNKARHGEDYYSRIGKMGGLKGKEDGVIKGFAANRELACIAGARGGKKSRRGPNKTKHEILDVTSQGFFERLFNRA